MYSQCQKRAVQQASAPATPTHAQTPSHAIYEKTGTNIQDSPIQPQQNVIDGSPVFNQHYTQVKQTHMWYKGIYLVNIE